MMSSSSAAAIEYRRSRDALNSFAVATRASERRLPFHVRPGATIELKPESRLFDSGCPLIVPRFIPFKLAGLVGVPSPAFTRSF